MWHCYRFAAMVLGVLGLYSCLLADAKVEQQEVGPAGRDATYVVSARGVHLASVTNKGSRTVVIIDGVSGPKVDQIITPAAAWVDPRPWAALTGYDLPHAAPVTFSQDGSRWAYVARIGQEWILMADGKEVMRIPASGTVGAVSGIAGTAGNTDLRLQFTGESGTHLLMACSTFNGYELWVDGQKWPGTYSSGGGGTAGTVDPLVSPDGQRTAYVAQVARDKSALLLDGKDTGYLADNLQFTADSKHLIGRSQDKDGQSLLLDGKPLIKARGLIAVYLSPGGKRIVAVLQHQDAKGIGQFLWVNGKPVETSLCETIKKVVFSPDGQHYAALCGRTGAEFMVVDGKKGQEYQSIADGSGNGQFEAPRFSPDGTKFGYTSHVGGKGFVVINDEESDAFMNSGSFLFSPASKHVVMTGISTGGGDWHRQVPMLIIDDKAKSLAPNMATALETFTFSPDESRYAYIAGGNPHDGGAVFVDAKPTGITGLVNFSPDSKHVCVSGYRATDNKHGLFLDGQLVYSGEQAIIYRAFTADSGHLFWMTREPAKGADAAPGSWEFVTYLDGKPVARANQTQQTDTILLPRGSGSFVATTPAWGVASDGTLMCLAPSADTISRIRIVPGNDTSLASLLSSGESQPAGAKLAPAARH
jgi:hypothetical protein